MALGFFAGESDASGKSPDRLVLSSNMIAPHALPFFVFCFLVLAYNGAGLGASAKLATLTSWPWGAFTVYCRDLRDP